MSSGYLRSRAPITALLCFCPGVLWSSKEMGTYMLGLNPLHIRSDRQTLLPHILYTHSHTTPKHQLFLTPFSQLTVKSLFPYFPWASFCSSLSLAKAFLARTSFYCLLFKKPFLSLPELMFSDHSHADSKCNFSYNPNINIGVPV